MIIFLFLLQLVIIQLTYVSLLQRKRLFDDRFGKTYTFATTGVSGFILSMMLVFLFPEYSIMVIISIVIGGIIGAVFGGLYKMQTVLLGTWNGAVGALMGSMLGLVVLDPALCGLPGVAARDIVNNILLFSIFGTIVLYITMWLVRFSLRV
ncbi:hypothetical protein JOC85_003553 [Bacillus mesophilus]|uniref:Uncharacterized protein n=1 Tax=Bacillus mesophilus TaxID=1808955 RepID=A0A6M0QAB3_9BACI|nr:hypothetical protein [Bacillus mesophilus]MBM7662743.1 hypothetical protein [Bacillus mesophilus]NEY73197.1 hypothetical protein [Bacillus mesophilus]